MPDIHKLNPYELSFINEKMSKVSKELKYNYLDLLSTFDGQPQKKYGMIMAIHILVLMHMN